MKPGIYTNLSNADYHATEGLSSSNLKELVKSAAHYQASLKEVREETAQQRMGTMVHTMLLQPDQVTAQIHVGEYKTRRGKDFEAALEEGAGKLVVSREEYNTAQEIAEAFRAQAMEHPYLNGQKYKLMEGVKEQSYYWTCPKTGLLLKARPDNITPSGVIVDLKICRDVSVDGFRKAIAEYGYHISAAHYLAGVNANPVAGQSPPTAFAFICIESTAPYLMATYFIDEASLSVARDQIERALAAYLKGQKTGVWEGYPKRLVEIGLPQWYYYKTENGVSDNE